MSMHVLNQPFSPATLQIDAEAEVERIVAQRGRGARTRFLVYWKGYPLEEATWEPRAAIASAPDCLKEFLDSQS